MSRCLTMLAAWGLAACSFEPLVVSEGSGPSCAEVECTEPAPTCLPGQRLEDGFPDCCGTCVADPSTCSVYSAPPCDEGEILSSGVDGLGCPLPPQCVCPDDSTTTTGLCPCFPACDACYAGDTYPVDEPTTCCGYRCESCPIPESPSFSNCAGNEVPRTDANGCPDTPECRCPSGALSSDGTCDGQCTDCQTCGAGTYEEPDLECCGYLCKACPPPALGPYLTCEGIESELFDANGCIAGYECRCPDYTVSPDGKCADTNCDLVYCEPCGDGQPPIDDGSCCGYCSGGVGTCTYHCKKGKLCVPVACP